MSISETICTCQIFLICWILIILLEFFFFWDGVSLCCPGWSVVAWSQLTATLASRVQASVSWVARSAGTHYYFWLIFVFLVETAFYHVVQAGFKLLTSSNPPASASQSARITGVSHSARPEQVFNADETSLFWHYCARKTLTTADETAPTGIKTAKDRVTVLGCANMEGMLKCKPTMIDKSLHPPCFQGVNFLFVSFFEMESCPVIRLSALEWSQLTVTSKFLVQLIFLPQPPEWLGLQARTTMPG